MKLLALCLALCLALALSGCATLKTPEGFAACKVADLASTKYAVDHGAHEVNPLFAGDNGKPRYVSLAVVGLAGYYLLRWLDSPSATLSASALTCGVVAHNVWTVR